MISASWIGAGLPPIYRDGVEYLLVAYQDALYLVDNRCPHRGGALKCGYVSLDDEIVCPLHAGRFPIAQLIARPSTIRLEERPKVAP